MLRGVRLFRYVSNLSSTSSSEMAISSRKPCFKRRIARSGSTSITRPIPSFIVMAIGCAPPIPPRPAVTTTFPASDPPK